MSSSTDLIWATDLHFDVATSEAFNRFIKDVKQYNAKGLIVSGDFSQSAQLLDVLGSLNQQLAIPLYFVLGNHDYYGSSFEEVTSELRSFLPNYPLLKYLPLESVLEINKDIGLVGENGWADGLSGHYLSSSITLRDSIEIADFFNLSKNQMFELVKELGKKASLSAKKKLIEALNRYSKVIFVTHVPPFPEGALYKGHLPTFDWAPHFVCQQMGEVVVDLMQKNPEKQMIVLSGHAHHIAKYRPLPNLLCMTGESDYGYPKVQGKIEFHH